jgi:hypothetical protein
MPGHFTHIYTARRVAEALSRGDAPEWPGGDKIDGALASYKPEDLGRMMVCWPKFTAVGAVGPDLFYFSQDYNGSLLGPRTDEIMLALATYYFYDYSKENDWEPLLIILDEVNSTLAALIRFLIKLDKIWQDFVKAWNETIGRFVNAADTLLDDLTGGVISQFQVALEEFKQALILVGEEELLTFKDIFTFFDTCVHKGWDEQNFLWSDMTHYRRTTRIVRALVDQAEALDGEDKQSHQRFEQFMAFALGWATHVGLDTVAHSFVNEQCGGPFRTHPQRHHLIENHIDAWIYRQAGADGTISQDDLGATDTYPDLSMSGFWYAIHFDPDHPDGKERPATLPDDPDEAKDALDVDGEMPLWMAEAIVRALKQTFDDDSPRQDDPATRPRTHPRLYQGGVFQQSIDQGLLADVVRKITGHELDHPFQDLLDAVAPPPPPDLQVPEGFPLPWQVRTVYRFMFSFYKLSYWGGWELSKPRRPAFIITPPASDVTDLLQPPDFSGVSSGDPIEDICNAIKALVEWVEHEIEAAEKLAGDLIKMLASPGTYPIRLALYELAMLAWDVISKTHEILAHTGFLIPHGEQRYDDGELRLGNEIDLPLITLGSSVDAAFRQALGDATDPFGNLDTNQGLLVDHDVQDPRYPYHMVMQMDAGGLPLRAPDGSMTNVEFRRPWAYPDRSPGGPTGLAPTPTEISDPTQPAAEQPPSTTRGPLPGPYPAGTTPDAVFFRINRPVSQATRAAYELARTPSHTDSLNEAHLGGREPVSPLGDPIPFALYLIGQLTNRRDYPTQFNLDADRGYGYLTWDWIRNAEVDAISEMDFHFPGPFVWPQLSPQWPGPAMPSGANRMQLEYVDKPLGPIVVGMVDSVYVKGRGRGGKK